MKMNTEDTFMFIEIVQGEDILWNIKSNGYKNVKQRTKLWSEIGVKFSLSGDEAYKYFRKLREKYRREIQNDKIQERSGSSQPKASNWIFKKHLEFLSDAFKSRSVNSSLEWDTNEFNVEYLEDPISEIFDLTQNSLEASTSKTREIPKLMSSPPKKKSTQDKNFEEIINNNTQQLIQALNGNESTTPFDGVIEFIKETLRQQSESSRIMLEKELMEIAIKYRYKT